MAEAGTVRTSAITRPRGEVAAAVVAVAVVAPVVSFVAFGSTGRDDPYITFAAAEQFRSHLWIANVNGDPVEQSTSFLFTLVLAFLGSVLPLPTYVLGWGLGFLGLGCTAVLALLLMRRYLGLWSAVLAALAVSLLPPLIYWGASGAEQTWVAASLLAVILTASLQRDGGSRWIRVFAPASMVALAFLLRPDAGLAALGALGIFAVLATMPSTEHLGPAGLRWRLVLVSGAAIGVITIARWAWTGTALPQSVMAKAQSNYESWDWSYLMGNAFLPYFLAILGVAALAWVGYRGRLPLFDSSQWLLALISLVLMLVLLRSGPDWMEAGRLWVPPATLLTMLVLSRLGSVGRWQTLGLTSVVLAVNAGTIAVWSVDTSNATFGVGLSGSRPGDRWILEGSTEPLNFWGPADSPYNSWNSVHAKDAQFLTTAVPLIRTYLETQEHRPVTVGGGDAGMVFYFLKQEFGDDVTFIDRWSLVSPSFTPCSDVNRTPVGTGMSFGKWAQWIEEGRDCVPPLPDIAFDNDFPGEKEQAYYDIVFQQDGAWLRKEADVGYGNAMWLGFIKDDVETFSMG